MSNKLARLNPAVSSRDGMTEPQRAELHFWQLCYAAAISAGPFNASNGTARMAADQGVADLRRKMTGRSTPPDDCVSPNNSEAAKSNVDANNPNAVTAMNSASPQPQGL